MTHSGRVYLLARALADIKIQCDLAPLQLDRRLLKPFLADDELIDIRHTKTKRKEDRFNNPKPRRRANERVHLGPQ